MRRYVIHRNSLPTSIPIQSTLLLYIILDKFHAPGWVWGMVMTFYAIMWLGAIILIIQEERVHIMENYRPRIGDY